MRRAGTVVGLWILCLSTASVGQAQPNVNGPRLPSARKLARLEMTEEWTARLGGRRGLEQINALYVDEGMVFLSTTEGGLHCVDANTGQHLWTTKVSRSGYPVNRPTVAEDRIFVASGVELLELDRSTGRVLHRKPLQSFTTAGPALAGNVLFCETADHRMSAFNLKPTETYKFTRWPRLWFFQAKSDLFCAPVVRQNVVALLTGEGTLYAFAGGQRRLLYRYVTGSPTRSPLASFKDMAYFGSDNTSVYALDLAKQGETVWRYRASYPVEQKVLALEKDVFIVPVSSGLHCVDAQTGEARWVNPEMTRVLGASPDRVFAYDRAGDLAILSREDGRTIGTLPLADFTVPVDNQHNDRLYMATPDGVVICLRESARPEPHLHAADKIDLVPEAMAGDGPSAGEQAIQQEQRRKKASSFFGNDDTPEPAEPKSSGGSMFDEPEEKKEMKKEEPKRRSLFDDF
ncbi:outer membrane biogenesis protein BamB [Planctomycetes bacterium Pan216]|uniref:Outer membrane biogenesis protein BamB n=1 Tax=Kolteria novifilia TaxID=2527975 RepID=A0A518BBN9_9BACT|nr:outer membrane biogenesis protein BamB [Planctomycetes bacterium Pan216]